LWQRHRLITPAGNDCRAQFELHRTVNPADVENAAWHFLRGARWVTAKARAALLPVGPDSRVPMRQI
jgi:lipoprotein NlpI